MLSIFKFQAHLYIRNVPYIFFRFIVAKQNFALRLGILYKSAHREHLAPLRPKRPRRKTIKKHGKWTPPGVPGSILYSPGRFFVRFFSWTFLGDPRWDLQVSPDSPDLLPKIRFFRFWASKNLTLPFREATGFSPFPGRGPGGCHNRPPAAPCRFLVPF